jgi:uncharacterized protein (DUF488 family)
MLGHSNHDWRSFVALLEKHEIGKLIDVRTSPYSRLPHFCSGFLRRTLPEGMYEHWPALGGLKRFDERAVRRGVRQLLHGANGSRLCLMCSEGDYRACHRHTLLTPIVRSLAWRVMQIDRSGALTEDYGPRSQKRGLFS